MSVEYGAELVDWDTFKRLWEEHGDGEFYYEAEDCGAVWMLKGGPYPHWVDSWKAAIDFSDAFKRLRGSLAEDRRSRFESFLSNFCLTDESEGFRPPRDLGEDVDEMLFFSTISPQTARRLHESWEQLDMEELRLAYEENQPYGFYVDTFEDFANYPKMWSDLLRDAVSQGAGIVVTLA